MPKSAQPEQELRIAGVRLSNPERVLYPDQGVTKRQLAEHYQRVADYMLPHLAGRPLSLLRCPRGPGEPCFFQRRLDGRAPPGIEQVTIADANGQPATHLIVRDLAGLIGLAQLGVLEIHPWGATAADPDYPDRLIFDLDPGAEAIWEDVLHGARWLHRRLAALGLQSFLRTTGGKGLHVVAPLAPERDWETLKTFAGGVAEQLAADNPLRYVTTPGKAERVGKVYVDYLRNARGASSIANYSPRARKNAPVATPLLWSDLTQLDRSDACTIGDIPARLKTLPDDPWTGFFELDQALTDAMVAEVSAVRRH